jgi:hypothetical protein
MRRSDVLAVGFEFDLDGVHDVFLGFGARFAAVGHKQEAGGCEQEAFHPGGQWVAE